MRCDTFGFNKNSKAKDACGESDEKSGEEQERICRDHSAINTQFFFSLSFSFLGDIGPTGQRQST